MGNLEGKVALVTGGNRGIGKGIALALAREGASLAITARGAEALAATAEEITAQTDGVPVLAVPGDVTDENHVQQMFASVETATRCWPRQVMWQTRTTFSRCSPR